MEGEKIAKTTFSTVRATFGGLAAYTALRSLNTDDNKKQLTTAIACLILLIAFFHYSKMMTLYEQKNYDELILIRYSDWIITVPLLIFELFLLMEWIEVGEDGKLDFKYLWEFWVCIIFALIMLLSGYVGETMDSSKTGLKIFLFAVACISLIIIGCIVLWLYNKDNKEGGKWIIGFFLIWVAYAYGYGKQLLSKDPGYNSLEDNSVNIVYNISDLFSKGVFAFVATTIAD